MEFPGTVFKKGDTRAHFVIEIQKRLNALGCGPIQEDGTYWTKTIAAVKLFQFRNELHDDGEIGPTTWNELFEQVAPIQRVPPNALLREVLACAQSQVGIRETPGRRNRGPEVDQYLRAAGYDPDKRPESYAWCMAFVYWCYLQASKAAKVPNPCPRTGGVVAAWTKAPPLNKVPAAQAYDDPGLIVPGCIFVMDYGEGVGHAGIVKQVQGSKLLTLEGNTNGAGSREGDGVYEKSSRTVKQVNLGFIDFSRTQQLQVAA